MPDKKKNKIAKAIDKYKAKRATKKIAKIQSSGPKDKLDAQGKIIFKNGGKTKTERKVKKAGKKTIRKINRGKDVQTQSAKDIMAKVVRRTQDPVKGGSGTIKKTTPTQKARSKAQSVLSTRAKGKLSSVNKAVKKELGYSKGGFIQYD